MHPLMYVPRWLVWSSDLSECDFDFSTIAALSHDEKTFLKGTKQYQILSPAYFHIWYNFVEGFNVHTCVLVLGTQKSK